MDNVVDSAVSQLRLLTYLMAGFAAFALLLAVVGIYGMLAYAVSQRQQEISIRLALGASRAGLLWLVLRQGLVLALTGAAIGAAGGIVLSRSMAEPALRRARQRCVDARRCHGARRGRRARRLPDPRAARRHRRTARRPARRIASHLSLPLSPSGERGLLRGWSRASPTPVPARSTSGWAVHPTSRAGGTSEALRRARRNLGHDASPPNPLCCRGAAPSSSSPLPM